MKGVSRGRKIALNHTKRRTQLANWLAINFHFVINFIYFSLLRFDGTHRQSKSVWFVAIFQSSSFRKVSDYFLIFLLHWTIQGFPKSTRFYLGDYLEKPGSFKILLIFNFIDFDFIIFWVNHYILIWLSQLFNQ